MNERGSDTPDRSSRSVRETYDRIASHFSSTRAYPWPEVESFLETEAGRRRDSGTTIDRSIDVGCGNGRHSQLLSAYSRLVVGADVSVELLGEAALRADREGFNAEWVCCDATELPFGAGEFDVAVYVATIHHIRPRSSRLRSLDELARILAPDGRALVSAWSTAHDRFDADTGFDTTIDWTLPGGERVPRYYHIYDPGEFEADLERSELRVIRSFVSSGNCYAVVGT